MSYCFLVRVYPILDDRPEHIDQIGLNNPAARCRGHIYGPCQPAGQTMRDRVGRWLPRPTLCGAALVSGALPVRLAPLVPVCATLAYLGLHLG